MLNVKQLLEEPSVTLGRRRLIPFRIGRTWKNSAGLTVGRSGSDPVSVGAAGIIVDSLDADHGLMNQESQAIDSSGLIHTIISYVPGERCIEVQKQILSLFLT